MTATPYIVIEHDGRQPAARVTLADLADSLPFNLGMDWADPADLAARIGLPGLEYRPLADLAGPGRDPADTLADLAADTLADYVLRDLAAYPARCHDDHGMPAPVDHFWSVCYGGRYITADDLADWSRITADLAARDPGGYDRPAA